MRKLVFCGNFGHILDDTFRSGLGRQKIVINGFAGEDGMRSGMLMIMKRLALSIDTCGSETNAIDRVQGSLSTGFTQGTREFLLNSCILECTSSKADAKNLHKVTPHGDELYR